MKVAIIALLFFCALLPGQLALYAQPPSESPPPGEPPNRLQRRERLQRLWNLGGRLLEEFTTPQPGTNVPGQPRLDTGKINAAVEIIVGQLLKNQPVIESLHVSLDENLTNLAEDRVGLVASAALNRTAWSGQMSQLHLELQARVESIQRVPQRAVVGGRISVTTDVLALANHALPRLKKLLGRDGSSADDSAKTHTTIADSVELLPPPGTEPIQEKTAVEPGEDPGRDKIQEKLLQTDRIASMDHMADLITYISAQRFLSTVQRIEQLRAALDSATSPAQQQQLADQLAQARHDREVLLSIRPLIERGSEGTVQRIVITAPGSQLPNGRYLDHLEVIVSAQQIDISGAGSWSEGLKLYGLVKPLVTATLWGLQQADPKTLEMQRQMIEQLLKQAWPEGAAPGDGDQ